MPTPQQQQQPSNNDQAKDRIADLYKEAENLLAQQAVDLSRFNQLQSENWGVPSIKTEPISSPEFFYEVRVRRDGDESPSFLLVVNAHDEVQAASMAVEHMNETEENPENANWVYSPDDAIEYIANRGVIAAYPL
ncbi:MAG: hypothetical protein ACRCT6_04130 [Notoacmeibacter sp.]